MANLIKRHEIFNPNFFRDFFEDDFLTDSFFHKRISPPINISESEDGYSVEVSTPGIEKDNIKIQRQKNILTISYEQNDRKVYEEKNYHRREFQSRSFSRSINLPEDVDIYKITSAYSNGILTISVPKLKSKVSKDEVIDIEIK